MVKFTFSQQRKEFEEAVKGIQQKLGDNPSPSDSILLLIANQLMALTNEVSNMHRSLSNQLHWLLGATGVAIALLIAIVVSVF